MTELTITNISGITLPVSAYTCDVYGNQCIYAGEILSTPVTLSLNPQFNTAPALGLKLLNNTCQKFEILDCQEAPCFKPSGLTQYLLVYQYECSPNPTVYLTGSSVDQCITLSGYTVPGCSTGGYIPEIDFIGVGGRLYNPYTTDCGCYFPDGTYPYTDFFTSLAPPYTFLKIESCVITAIEYC
jgi:hypothetical protein